jgi:tripartite ATP-independent transporter DctP family solute receptor
MKKRSLGFVSFLVLLLIATIIFHPSFVTIANALELKLGHSGSLEHQYHIGAMQFKKLVEEKSNGEIKVNIFPQGQLGGERDLAEGVRIGTIEIGALAAGNFGGFVPEVQLFGIPFLFDDRDQVYALLDGAVGNDLNQMMSSKGFINLAYWEVGFRHLTNNVRPINTPADVKGLKIRVQESKIWMEFMKALGAIPTPIPFGELYTALQQKVVDGQENPVASIYSMKFYEVQKYLSLTAHTYEPALVLANSKWFNGLSSNQQQIIKEAAAEATVYQRQFLAEKEKEYLNIMKDAGLIVEENPDREAFKEATAHLSDVIADLVSPAFVQKVREEAAKLKE